MAEVRDFATSKRASIHFLNVDVDSLSRISTKETPETFMLESLKMRPRAMSHHLSTSKVPSRLWLKVQANFWRSCMALGMQLHDIAGPTPPKPSFVRKIPTNTIPITLYFYTPPNYTSLLTSGHRFPVVANFHGGGFCLGNPTDDRYWARVVLQRTSAVFVSIGYRRAPEHPFPIPVDDSVEALLYLAQHAADLGLDTSRVALSGFSAGANLAFAVPLRMKYHTFKDSDKSLELTPTAITLTSSHNDTPSSSSPPILTTSTSTTHLLHPSTQTTLAKPTTPPLTITSIIAWYPLLDWTQSRNQKKRTSLMPSKCLPKVFTDLFDASYLPPPDKEGSHCSPFASPGLAPDPYLKDGLPQDIQMWLCEWDMLLMEGELFTGRLEGAGKKVAARIVPKAPHGWDKSPSPFRDQAEIDRLYEKAAGELRDVFDGHAPTQTDLHITTPP